MASSRGTTSKNAQGLSYDVRARKHFLLTTWESDEGPGTCRCYRCGDLLDWWLLTVDRVVPGCMGGTYRRTNIRPACGPCNWKTGAALASRRKKIKKAVVR